VEIINQDFLPLLEMLKSSTNMCIFCSLPYAKLLIFVFTLHQKYTLYEDFIALSFFLLSSIAHKEEINQGFLDKC